MFTKIKNSEHEKWSLRDLEDLIYGFEEFINEYLEDYCVKGVIEIRKRKYN